MHKVFISLLASLALACSTPSVVQAQTANQVPSITTPAPLTRVEAYNYLVGFMGFDPFDALDIITKSETAYGLYFTLDQLLAIIPKE